MASVDELLTRNPRVLGGAAVFRGTRVPLQALLDYLSGGESIEEFLIDYPGVSRESAVNVIQALGATLGADPHAAAS